MTVFRERCVFRIRQTFLIGFTTWFDFDKKMRNFRGFRSKHTRENKKRFAKVFGRRRLKILQNGSFHNERYFEAEHNVFCKFAMPVQYMSNEKPF